MKPSDCHLGPMWLYEEGGLKTYQDPTDLYIPFTEQNNLISLRLMGSKL